MHARNRSPGNGYRGNAMGMGGMATASRISPESSMRGHGGYNSEYRGYGRGGGGFGRGQSKQFHRTHPRPLPPPQKGGGGGGDILMEAGRLATEYLVAKGLLPANVLSGKWQNGSLKNQVGAQEGDGTQLPFEGRTSALSRLGGGGADFGPGRRRYVDDYNSRSSVRGRRRNGSFKNYGSDWSRDFGRSGSWSERSRAFMDGEDDSDVLSRHRDEQQVSNDGDSVSQNSIPELSPESDAAGAKESDIVGDMGSASEKYKSMDGAGAKENAFTSSKDLLLKTGEEPIEKDDTKVSNVEADEVKDGQINDEAELKQTKDETIIMASSEEGALASEKYADLLKLSRFAKVPTRTRSSMVVRGSKVDPDPMIVDENSCEGEPPKESGARAEVLTVDNFSGDGSLEHTYDSKALNLDNLTVPVPEDKLGQSCSLVQGSCTAPVSFLDRSSVKEHEQPDFGGIKSMISEHGEKRALDDGNTCMGSKKPRELAPFVDAESDGGLSILEPLDKRETSEPMTSEGQSIIFPSDEKRLLDMSLYPKGDIEPCVEYTEEKQLFPGSFKTCDLNLMEASDVNENHDTNPVLIFPSDTENGKQSIPVDIDLSMGNNPRVSNRYGKCIVDGKDIEVIDLENDSAQDDKDSNNSDRRNENVFNGLGGFSNNAVNANDIPDGQDGYGLMISELLGNDIPNCSTVPADMNSLHNDMGLHNGEGILGDDDSIYMSLGEIPIIVYRKSKSSSMSCCSTAGSAGKTTCGRSKCQEPKRPRI